MSKNNSKKEFLFAIFLKNNKEILERELGVSIKDIHLEKWFKNRRVDMNCITQDGNRLLVELQMDFHSYKGHERQVKQLVDVVEEGEKTIIIYAMLEFREEVISELTNSILQYSEKNLELIFLKIDYRVLDILKEINELNEVNRLKELRRLKDTDKLFAGKKGIKLYNDFMAVGKVEENDKIYSYEEKLLINIVKRLREDCSEISTNVYQYKNVNGNNFILGSGYEDITYKVACDRRARVSIELCFNGKMKRIFHEFLKNKDFLNNEFNFILKFDERYEKIGTYYPVTWFITERELMIKRFCRDVKAYLIGFNVHIKRSIEQIKNNM